MCYIHTDMIVGLFLKCISYITLKIVNHELKIMWKKVVMTLFRGTQDNHGNSQSGWLPGQESNLGPV
jgi:hypothetical protein